MVGVREGCPRLQEDGTVNDKAKELRTQDLLEPHRPGDTDSYGRSQEDYAARGRQLEGNPEVSYGGPRNCYAALSSLRENVYGGRLLRGPRGQRQICYA
jgi:hypothetical protein